MNNNIENKPSETAGFITYFRACSNKEKRPQLRGPDYLAKVFHIGSAKIKLKISRILLPLLKKYIPGIYEWVIARTFVFDEIFQEALKNKYDQIIILGAGFDSRAFRFKNYNINTDIFELDIPTTQECKKKILEKSNTEIPKNLIYVPINFNKNDLYTTLHKKGFKKNAKNLFLWEGVTEYLNEDVVDSTLNFIKQNSLPKSQVALTYVYKEIIEGDFRFYGSKQIIKMTSKVGEHYQFGIKQGEIEKFIKKRGYNLLKNWTPEDLEKEYLTDENGCLYGKIGEYQCIALIEVK